MKRILAIAVALILVSPFFVQAQTTLQYCPDTNSRAVYWLEDLNDQTINNFSLTNHNSVSFETGIFNNSANFGNVNTSKYLDVASNLGYAGGDITISLWIKFNNEVPTNTAFTLAMIKDGAVSNTEIWFQYLDEGGIKKVRIARTRTGIITAVQTVPITSLFDGFRHHFVATYESSTGNLKLYLDNPITATVSTNQVGTGSPPVVSRFVLGTFINASDIAVSWSSVKFDEVVVDSTVWDTTKINAVFLRSNPPIGCPPPNPVPTTISISPTSIVAGSPGFTMVVNGTNFVSGSVVKLSGSNRTTTFVSSTQLTAQILIGDLTTASTFPITVFNPSPGGDTSNPQTFTVTTNSINNLDILLSTLRDAITAPAPNNKNLKDLFDKLQAILNQLDVALSTRASESTLFSAKNTLDLIKLRTDNLDVLLSTRASETTQLLVKSALDAIKLKTDNLDVLLSSRASELTLQGVKAGTDKLDTNLSTRASEATLNNIATKLQTLIDGDKWQRAAKDGKAFIVTTNKIVVPGTAEFNFFLLKNAAGSGKNIRIKIIMPSFAFPSADTTIRIYKNPTITSNGALLSVNNLKSSGGASVGTTAFKLPVAADGTLMDTFQVTGGGFPRDFELAFFLEPGENLLITVEPSRMGI